MKIVMTALVSAFMLMSAPSFAGSHGGGKMDDKKVDCSKKENEKNAACVKKEFFAQIKTPSEGFFYALIALGPFIQEAVNLFFA